MEETREDENKTFVIVCSLFIDFSRLLASQAIKSIESFVRTCGFSNSACWKVRRQYMFQVFIHTNDIIYSIL